MSAQPANQSPRSRPADPPLSRTDSGDLNGISRSVSISDQTPVRKPMDTESSADEQTAIVQRHKGVRRNYDSTHEGRKPSQPASLGSTTQIDEPAPRTSQVDGSTQVADEGSPRLSWWKNFVDKYGTVELQNKGSVARDHLALERTFLAWLRTSLSFASIGIAVTQLFRLDQTLAKTPHDHPRVQKLRHVGKPLGATFLAVGIVVLAIGFHRYFESQHYVMLGKFPASRASVAVVAFCAGALTVASLVVVLSVAPSVLS